MRKLVKEVKSITWIKPKKALKLTMFTLIASFVLGTMIALFNACIQHIVDEILMLL